MIEITACAECGMLGSANEYHPYAACIMYKACHNSATVRANLNAVLEKGSALQAQQITELTARAERLQAELAEAHGYGSRLFLRLNPQCEVFDNMPSLMTQFDNYIAGQLQDIAAEKAAREKAEQEVADIKAAITEYRLAVERYLRTDHRDDWDRLGIADEQLRAALER